jgi:hypothetical protein
VFVTHPAIINDAMGAVSIIGRWKPFRSPASESTSSRIDALPRCEPQYLSHLTCSSRSLIGDQREFCGLPFPTTNATSSAESTDHHLYQADAPQASLTPGSLRR